MMDYQGSLMEVYMLGRRRAIAKPNSTSEVEKDSCNSSRSMRDVDDNIRSTMGNWRGMPALNGFDSPDTQKSASSWREGPGIYGMRISVRREIAQILCGNVNSNRWNQVKFRNLCAYIENNLFMAASDKAGYGNSATLSSRVKFAVRSIKSRIQAMQVDKGCMESISRSTPQLQCSVGLLAFQQHDQQFPVQGLISSVKMSSDSSSQNRDGLPFQNYPQRYAKPNHTQSPALSNVNCNGDAVSSRDYGLFWHQHQELQNRTVPSNFETHQAPRQHYYADKATVPMPFDAGLAKPRKPTYQTRKVDDQTGGISPAEYPTKKRKIDHTSNLPLSIDITDHQTSKEMHPHCVDEPSVTPFSGYEIPPCRHDSPLQKHQQCPARMMSYGSSVTEADMDECFDSPLSRELVHGNGQEPILDNIINKGKAEEEESSHPRNDYLAGFASENFRSEEEIKEPDKIRGASLTEMFTLNQLEAHVASLKQWIGEPKTKVDEKLAMGECKNDDACQLCAVEKLFFAVSCFLCGTPFKKTDTYHSASESGVAHRCCNKCYKRSESDKTSTVSGVRFDKEKISLEIDTLYQEQYVECDKCGCWQHFACALFNNERNVGGKAAYICPKCSIQEMKDGLRVPLAPSVIRGAADLPRTKLSDYIEGRLFSRLKQERDGRAKVLGKNSGEVSGAEDLVVRVVLSVEKRLLVKQELLDVLKEENYPKELPYRSKVILLFQKIDGADVCLFGMYAQEYGSKCAPPNQRSIYISYLDSVRYFRPDDVATATGESLRTFVYHEILVGYLDYCKKRGFSKCYIWSCPPASKAAHYIFYHRPEIQKSPTVGALRDWYKKMLRKAESVATVTNLYDHFFVPHGEHKVTAARLPYFDGDYFPLSVNTVLKELADDKLPPTRKARKKNPSSEAVGCTDASGNTPSDGQLMLKLGDRMKNKRRDFIIVDLGTQHMTKDTDGDSDGDADEVIEGNIFDGRDNFLDFCVENHFQFDNLQRAKHSTMMFLHHLHNPEKQACQNGMNPETVQVVPPRGKYG